MKTEIQISDDENTVTINGQLLKFYPVKKVKGHHCNYCWIYRGIPAFNCYAEIPCGLYRNRFDKKIGVFSIREMPEIND